MVKVGVWTVYVYMYIIRSQAAVEGLLDSTVDAVRLVQRKEDFQSSMQKQVQHYNEDMLTKLEVYMYHIVLVCRVWQPYLIIQLVQKWGRVYQQGPIKNSPKCS